MRSRAGDGGLIMADDLDQLSRLLGRVEAELAEGARQRDALFNKLDDIEKMIHEQNGAMRVLAAQVAQQSKDHAELKEIIEDEIKPVVDDYKGLKNKGMGVIAFIGFVSAGSGAMLMHWLGAPK
jgi:chromosome segregation ATPase